MPRTANRPPKASANGTVPHADAAPPAPLPVGSADLSAGRLSAGRLSAEEPEFARLALENVHPWHMNPRKTYDPDELARLAESIRVNQVLEPVLVRPRPEGGYWLIFGERRYLASRLAGALVIPAMIRQMDDHRALTFAIVENDHRERVPPMQQAEGYAALIAMGDTVDLIAANTGRPPSYVAERLQLTQLLPVLQEELRADKLPLTHALLLARLQPVDQQELHPTLYDRYDPAHGRPVPLVDLKRVIKENRVLPLAAAPWKMGDSKLVPTAGSCTACPKNSGNNRTLFEDLVEGQKRGNYCTDGTCYRTKRSAFVDLEMKRLTAATGEEPVKVTLGFTASGPDVLTTDRYEVIGDEVELSDLIDGVLKAIIAEGAEAGRVLNVRVKPAARKGPGESDRAQAAREKAAAAGKLAAIAANEGAARRVERLLRDMAIGFDVEDTEVLRQLVVGLSECSTADTCRVVAKRRNLPHIPDARERIATHARGLDDGAELLGLVGELVASHWSQRWGSPHGDGGYQASTRTFWAAFGVDPNALLKAARAQLKKGGAGEPDDE